MVPSHLPSWTPELAAFFRGLPKAELHVHLEGALRPTTLAELARRNGAVVPEPTDDRSPARLKVGGFRRFTDLYSVCTDVFREAADFSRAVVELAGDMAPQGVLYAEVTCSAITHHRSRGIPFDEIVDGLWDGAQRALGDYGVVMRFVLDHVRDLPVEDCWHTVEWCVRGRSRGVVAVGLGGYEPGRPASLFAEAFGWARDNGVPVVPHAGEATAADGVRDALAFDPPRLGHGFRAAEDPEVVAELLRRGTVLELCPTSNLRTGVVTSLDDHPAIGLHAQGVPIVLGSDDPLLFGVSLMDEYRNAVLRLGLSPAELTAAARTSLESSLLDHEERDRLLAVHDRYLTRWGRHGREWTSAHRT